MKIRVGFGFDVHRLVTDRELWLGGVRLEHERADEISGYGNQAAFPRLNNLVNADRR